MKTKLLTHLKGNIFIVFALLSLLISIVLKVFFVNSKAYESYRAGVNQKINEELTLLESFSSNFKAQITSQKFNFSSFVADFPYTTLVFKHKNLVFWSDNQFLINYEPIANLQGVACLDTKQGIMLVYHERVNDSLDWCMILPIYVKYNIENDYIKSSVNDNFFPDDKISVSHTEEGSFHIKDPKDKFLFSIIFPEGFQYFSFHQYFVIFFALLALFFLYLEFRIVLLDLIIKKLMKN